MAVDMLAPFPGVDRKWSYDSGDYDPDATLSAAEIGIEMATGSSPVHVLLFHKGKYIGQVSPQAGGGFVQLRREDCTDDTVAVRIRIPGRSFAETKSLHNVDFTWRDGHVYWSGDWPFAEGPPLPGWREAQGNY
ncbi:MAG: hypothetical protein QOD88_2131 [Mycobacterium sp.]|nr:hypothetical protein [Mycobacterium sp.]